jgi:hypothetical protein
MGVSVVPRLSAFTASGVVEEELRKVGLRYDSSSAPAHDKLREEALSEDWWRAAGSIDENPRTPRNRALPRAYVRIAAGDETSAEAVLHADGLRLDRGKSIHMDRSVMSRLMNAGLVKFMATKSPYFELTAEGRAFMETD